MIGKGLKVEDLPHTSEAVVRIHQETLEERSMIACSHIVLQGKANCTALCRVVLSNDLPLDQVRLPLHIQRKLQVTSSQTVSILNPESLPLCRQLTVLPVKMADTTMEQYPGMIIDTYLRPLWRNMHLALQVGDELQLEGGFGLVQIRVVDTHPAGMVQVTADTRFTCKHNGEVAKFAETMTLFVQTAEGKKEEVKINVDDTVADLKGTVAPVNFSGAIVVGGVVYEDNSLRMKTFPPGSVVRFTPWLDLTLVKSDRSRSQLTVLAERPVSFLRQLARNCYSSSDALYDGDRLLDENLSFSFQKVSNHAEIRVVRSTHLSVATSSGPVSVPCTSEDSLEKVKLLAIVASHGHSKVECVLKLNGKVAQGKRKVGTLPATCELVLVDVAEKAAPGLVEEAASFMLKNLVPDTAVINTNMSVKTLQKRGFQAKNIFDPVAFYAMFLQYGSLGDGSAPDPKEAITLEVEVVSWGTLSMETKAGSTVRALKERIQQDIHVAPEDQIMMFNGEKLEDSRTLLSYNVSDCDTVRLLCAGANSYFLISAERFDPQWDFDYTDYDTPPDFGMRGGEKYIPPCGWYRYGLMVTGMYENEVWLGDANEPGEWIVSYHGTKNRHVQSIVTHGYDLSKGKRFVFGKGVYSAQDITEAELYASEFTWQQRHFRVMFMNRVNPDPTKLARFDGYFISCSDRDIRPYGLLIKELS